MRKLSAILLLCIFVFSQYARQLSYFECKFSNTFKVSSSKCDCEKLAGFENKDTNEAPLSKIHTHIHPDEFFNLNKIDIEDYLFFLNRLPVCMHPDADTTGCYPKPWEPPNS